MYVRKKRRLKAEINVVPYIDVMLVLLVIFMVTTPLITQGVKVELPKSAAEPIKQMQDGKTPLVATVDQDGLYYFEKDGKQQGPFTAAELTVEVASWLTIEPGTQVIGGILLSVYWHLSCVPRRASAVGAQVDFSDCLHHGRCMAPIQECPG